MNKALEYFPFYIMISMWYPWALSCIFIEHLTHAPSILLYLPVKFSVIYWTNKYLLSIYYLPGTVLDTEDTSVNKTDKNIGFRFLCF